MEEPTQIIVRVGDDDVDAQELDELTSRLRGELRELDLSIVDAQAGAAPDGSKAVELVAVGAFIVTLSQSAVLAALISAVSDWLGRRRQRSVKLDVGGDVVELSGVPSPEQDRLVEAWLRRREVRSGAATGRRHALIVANDDYRDPGLRRLRAPAHDAERLARVLSDPAIGGFDVQTLHNESAPTINEAVEEFFSDRDPLDLLVLYFSGHGVKDQDGELFFAAAPTKLNRLGATAVAADFVNRRMSRSQSRRIVLLLDCCYAGAFGRGIVARAGSDIAIEEQFGGRGRAVITASSAMEYAFEGQELTDASDGEPSVFTSALVEGLETGDADRDQDGYVGLDELYDFVYERVRARTPHQTPGKWVFDMRGDLHLARRSRPVSTPVPLSRELQDAIEHPLSGVRVGAVSELRRLLDNRHAGVALAARLALERMVDDDSRTVSAAATAALGPVAAAPVMEFEPAPVSAAVVEVEVADVPPAKPPPVVPRPRAEPVAPAAPAASPVTEEPAPAPVEPAAAGARRWIPNLALTVRGFAGAAALLLFVGYVMRLGDPSIGADRSWATHVVDAATIWLFLLIAGALVLVVRPPGRIERDAAAGAVLGLAAGLLGVLQGVANTMANFWGAGFYGAGFWIAVAGVCALLVAVGVNVARDRTWMLAIAAVAAPVLAAVGLIALLAFPDDADDLFEEAEGLSYVVFPAVGLLAVLALLSLVRQLWAGPRLAAGLGLLCVTLLATDAIITMVEFNGSLFATTYAPVLVVLLLVLALVDDERPVMAFAARVSFVLVLLLKVPLTWAAIQGRVIGLPGWLIALEAAAALAAAGALYLSRERLTAEQVSLRV